MFDLSPQIISAFNTKQLLLALVKVLNGYTNPTEEINIFNRCCDRVLEILKTNPEEFAPATTFQMFIILLKAPTPFKNKHVKKQIANLLQKEIGSINELGHLISALSFFCDKSHDEHKKEFSSLLKTLWQRLLEILDKNIKIDFDTLINILEIIKKNENEKLVIAKLWPHLKDHLEFSSEMPLITRTQALKIFEVLYADDVPPEYTDKYLALLTLIFEKYKSQPFADDIDPESACVYIRNLEQIFKIMVARDTFNTDKSHKHTKANLSKAVYAEFCAKERQYNVSLLSQTPKNSEESTDRAMQSDIQGLMLPPPPNLTTEQAQRLTQLRTLRIERLRTNLSKLSSIHFLTLLESAKNFPEVLDIFHQCIPSHLSQDPSKLDPKMFFTLLKEAHQLNMDISAYQNNIVYVLSFCVLFIQIEEINIDLFKLIDFITSTLLQKPTNALEPENRLFINFVAKIIETKRQKLISVNSKKNHTPAFKILTMSLLQFIKMDADEQIKSKIARGLGDILLALLPHLTVQELIESNRLLLELGQETQNLMSKTTPYLLAFMRINMEGEFVNPLEALEAANEVIRLGGDLSTFAGAYIKPIMTHLRQKFPSMYLDSTLPKTAANLAMICAYLLHQVTNQHIALSDEDKQLLVQMYWTIQETFIDESKQVDCGFLTELQSLDSAGDSKFMGIDVIIDTYITLNDNPELERLKAMSFYRFEKQNSNTNVTLTLAFIITSLERLATQKDGKERDALIKYLLNQLQKHLQNLKLEYASKPVYKDFENKVLLCHIDVDTDLQLLTEQQFTRIFLTLEQLQINRDNNPVLYELLDKQAYSWMRKELKITVYDIFAKINFFIFLFKYAKIDIFNMKGYYGHPEGGLYRDELILHFISYPGALKDAQEKGISPKTRELFKNKAKLVSFLKSPLEQCASYTALEKLRDFLNGLFPKFEEECAEYLAIPKGKLAASIAKSIAEYYRSLETQSLTPPSPEQTQTGPVM